MLYTSLNRIDFDVPRVVSFPGKGASRMRRHGFVEVTTVGTPTYQDSPPVAYNCSLWLSPKQHCLCWLNFVVNSTASLFVLR